MNGDFLRRHLCVVAAVAVGFQFGLLAVTVVFHPFAEATLLRAVFAGATVGIVLGLLAIWLLSHVLECVMNRWHWLLLLAVPFFYLEPTYAGSVSIALALFLAACWLADVWQETKDETVMQYGWWS